MKIFNKLWFIAALLLINNLYGQGLITNYKIHFNKMNQSENIMQINCAFDIVFEDKECLPDTLDMNFGGQLKEHAIQDLEVSLTPDIDYVFNAEDKKISFIFDGSNAIDTVHVNMNYVYMNISTAFNYRSANEFWETSYQEFYYPFIFGQKINFKVKVTVPDSIIVIGNYTSLKECKNDSSTIYRFATKSPVVSHSLILALLPIDDYKIFSVTVDDFRINYYVLRSIEISEKRITELENLTVASIDFFSRIFDDNYRNCLTGNDLSFVFHKNPYSNRNNGSFIIASQEKFATKPHILPMVHEIGHRWLGEWTLLIDDGKPGAYFIKESLNEYMTLLFAKHYYGDLFYDSLLQDEYISAYQKIRGTSKDTSLFSMKYNNNNTVVYRKGIIIIHKIVEIIGEDQWLDFMGKFYSKYKYDPELDYQKFIDLLSQIDFNAAKLLDGYVRSSLGINQ